MRNRRNKRNFNRDLLDYLKLITNLLLVLICLAISIFVCSSIKVKNSMPISKKQNASINTITEPDTKLSTEELLNNAYNNIINDVKVETSEHTDSKKSKTINLAFTGDIICGNSIYKDAYKQESNIYDFSYLFDNIKFNIQTADIAVGSLETDFSASTTYKSNEISTNPENLAYTLKKIGFDVLSTANNHSLDKGYSGLVRTIDILDNADLSHTGTFKSEEEKNSILIKNVKGLKIAFLDFSYGTNISIPSDKAFCINILNEHQIETQLALAKTEDPDLICVYTHWGNRYQSTPNADQQKWVDFLLKKGADIIIGNHPHVLQPIEKREITLPDGTIKQGFIAYSLGNFIADQTQNNTKTSAILNLKITKDYVNNKLNFDSISYTPIYIYKDTTKTTQKFSILNLKNTIASYEAGYDKSISNKNYTLFKTELQNIQKILGD